MLKTKYFKNLPIINKVLELIKISITIQHMTIKKIQLIMCALLSLNLFVSGYAHAESVIDTALSPPIVINEIQMNGVGTGTTAEEFIELANISDSPVAIDGWKLQYITSTGGTTKNFVTFVTGTVINPGGYLLLCPDSYTNCPEPSSTYVVNSSFTGLGSTGGSIALLNMNSNIMDLVGWGKNVLTKYETNLVAAPLDGQSIQRKTVDGKPVDTNDNFANFEALLVPSPNSNNPEIISETPPNPDPEPTPVPTPTTANIDDPNQVDITSDPNPVEAPTTELPVTETPIDVPPTVQEPSVVSQPILINELYIDPVSPETDSKNEWVELYNPNNTLQDLAGYTIYAGETFAYHHTFVTGTIIDSHGYLIITSADTSIALSNSGGAVKLTDPSGQVLDQTSYDAVKPGIAWAKSESGEWQWSTEPTPNLQNIIVAIVNPVPIITAATSAAKKSTKTTKVATAAKGTSSTKTPTTKTAAAKVTKVKAATDNAGSLAVIAAPSPLPVWLLAVLGTLAVLYSGYEYRFEVANKIYQYKQYRAARKTNR
jgi:Lamin Tail Domain